jgi:hypothetical protein
MREPLRLSLAAIFSRFLLLTTFWRATRLGGAAKSGVITTRLANVFDLCVGPFLDTDDLDGAVASRAEMFFTGRHGLDVAFFRRDALNHNRFTLGTDHGN